MTMSYLKLNTKHIGYNQLHILHSWLKNIIVLSVQFLSHIFQITFLTIQDYSIEQIKLLHEVCSLELNKKIDFLIEASKLRI